VVQPIGFDPSYARGAVSVSDTGVLAYRLGIAERRQLVWVDRGGKISAEVGAVDDAAIASPELTRDGRRIAVLRTVDGNGDVWLIDTTRGVPSRFTVDARLDGYPIWTADGRRVVYTGYRDGGFNLLEQPTTGAEAAVVRQTGLKIPMDVSSDQRFLLYAMQVPETGVDLWVEPLTSKAAPFPVVQTRFDEMCGQFSPDGRWIAYQSNVSGRMEVYVRPFAAHGSQHQVSSTGGSQPRWHPNGRELFYVAPNGYLMSVGVRATATHDAFESSAPTQLFVTRLATGANILPAVGSKQQYDVAPDGRFLMNVSVGPVPAITVAMNWQGPLKQ
jgi:Tol biopolymer transport system component